MVRIAFLSPSLPWSFGPYAQQLAFVAAALGEMGHDLVWISMLSRMRNQTYDEETLKTGLEAPGEGEPNHPLKGYPVVYAGTGVAHCGSGMYTSTLNAMLRRLDADAMISLMDHNRIFVDAPISVPSLAWFPDHYAELDMHHRHVFAAYSAAIALSPSSAAKVRRVMPYKRVEWIPHVVELPSPLAESDAPTKAQLRAAIDVPADAFIAFVAFGNYDQSNRKAVDISVLAFRRLLDVAPDAKLFVHAVDAEAVFNGTTAAKSSPGLDVAGLLQLADVPIENLWLHTERVPYHRVRHLRGFCSSAGPRPLTPNRMCSRCLANALPGRTSPSLTRMVFPGRPLGFKSAECPSLADLWASNPPAGARADEDGRRAAPAEQDRRLRCDAGLGLLQRLPALRCSGCPPAAAADTLLASHAWSCLAPGMPVLEAQLLGVPVITTAFAAMSDYTLCASAFARAATAARSLARPNGP